MVAFKGSSQEKPASEISRSAKEEPQVIPQAREYRTV